MARAPDSLRWLAGKEQALAGVHSGIAPARANSYGYHNSGQRHLSGLTVYGPRDYSVQQPADRRGDATLYSAIDWSHNAANMRLYTGRLVAAADRGDPRMRYLREFYGTVDNRTVVGRIHDSPDGPWRASSADLSHLSHIHKSFLREFADSQFAAEAVFSVERGESLTSWLARTSSGADLAMPVPSGRPLLRVGSSGLEVRSLQAGLNQALGLSLAVDGVFGPATEAAVKTLQRAAGITADGIYGPATANALAEELSMPTAKEIGAETVRQLLAARVTSRVSGNDVSLRHTVWGGTYLHIYTLLQEFRAFVAAWQAATGGQDITTAIRDELTRHRDQLADDLTDGLTDTLADRLTARLQQVPANEVRAAVREETMAVLSQVRITATPAGE